MKRRWESDVGKGADKYRRNDAGTLWFNLQGGTISEKYVPFYKYIFKNWTQRIEIVKIMNIMTIKKLKKHDCILKKMAIRIWSLMPKQMIESCK